VWTKTLLPQEAYHVLTFLYHHFQFQQDVSIPLLLKGTKLARVDIAIVLLEAPENR
jgi:hypothetical protein